MSGLSDFNDMANAVGSEAVRETVEAARPVAELGSVTSISAAARKWRQPEGAAQAIQADADQLVLAERFIDSVEDQTGERPVFSLGSFYTYDKISCLWRPANLDAIAVQVGSKFPGHKLCKKLSDYRQIASIVATLTEEQDFFANALGGVAAGGEFYRISATGEIVSEVLDAGHRQRLSVPAVPDFAAKAPLLSKLLDNALGSDDAGLAQQRLLQMGLGAALARILWRYRMVLMLNGASSTGKSTILEILKSFFPPDSVGATNPQNWGNEYHAAALAGRVLNLVGELDPNVAIQGGIFKAVTGGDVVEARHPTHRPFSFVCTAGHIFNCNRLPPTRDKSDAFFRRWRIVEFGNSVAPGAEIIGLADKIIAEEQAAVLAWLLQGAADLVRNGGFPETENHSRLIQYWRAGNNSALQFVLDKEYVELARPEVPVSAQAAFTLYRKWACDVGVKVMGRNAFYEALGDGGGRLGVVVADDRSGLKTVFGIGLRKEP